MRTKATIIDKAISFATKAHDGQMRNDGITPYIAHPIRVSSFFDDDIRVVVALLHDTVEDTAVTLEDIHKEFGLEVGVYVEHLTHREGEEYMDYITRVKKYELTSEIKIADILSNAADDPSPKALQKYRRALKFLTK